MAAASGIRIIFTQTLRTEDEQRAFYAQGRKPLPLVNSLRKTANLPPITERDNKKIITKARTVFNSFHGYGLAFDIAITDPSGKRINWDVERTDWNNDGASDWIQVGTLAGQIPGLEWGGNWSSMPDAPHFQMRFGLTIADLRAGKTPNLA